MPFGKLSKQLARKLDSKIERLTEQIQSFSTLSQVHQSSQSYCPPSQQPPNFLPPTYPKQSFPQQSIPSPSYPSQSDPKSSGEQDVITQSTSNTNAQVLPVVSSVAPLVELLAEQGTTNSIPLPAERGLCTVCAQYEWEYHFNRYDDDRILKDREIWDWTMKVHSSKRIASASEGLSIRRSPYPGQFSVEQARTKFTLQPYSAMIRNRESCSLCQLVVSAVESPQWSRDPEWQKRDTTSTQPVTCEIQQPKMEPDGFLGTPSLIVYIHEPYTTPIHFQNLNKALSLTATSYPNANHVDLDALKSWWTRCQQSHDGECRSFDKSAGLNHLGFLRVIDVLEQCVVTVPTDIQYAALSYKWGLNPIYTASRKEMAEGQLSLKGKPIPQTIRDAMTLVAVVGERYLWVDALCIVQDDPTDVTHYVEVMDRIYKAARFTIINASGVDANSGLEGLQPGSRSLKLARAVIDGIELIEQPKLVKLKESSWAGRAWTFQEYAFSPRKFIFADGCIFYQCDNGISSEFFTRSLSQNSCRAAYLNPHLLSTDWLDANATGGQSSNLSTGISIAVHGLATNDATLPLGYYLRSTTYYADRHATSQQDSLRAFQGVLSHLKSTFGLEFCWGLPTRWFYIVICWNVWTDEYRGFLNATDDAALVRYRKVRYRWDRIPQNEQARAWFPSWSWASSDYPWVNSTADPVWSKSCVIWPWDAGYSLHGSIDPFTTGVLRVEAECAILLVQAITLTFKRWFTPSRIILDDMTVLTQESMKFVRIADIVEHHVEPTLLVLGITESAGNPGTYRRRCALQLPLSAWDAVVSSREVIDLS